MTTLVSTSSCRDGGDNLLVLVQQQEKLREAAERDLPAVVRTLLPGLHGSDRRLAALVATALATILNDIKTPKSKNNQADETSKRSLLITEVAQRLLAEYRPALQLLVSSDQAAQVTAALRLFAAIAHFGGGYARETFLLAQPRRQGLLDLLRRQRQSRKRIRTRLSETERRATPLERALLQWLVAGASASQSFSSDLRELYIAFLQQVLSRIRFRRGGSDTSRIFRILDAAPWLNNGRILGSLLKVIEFIRNERERSSLVELVAQTPDLRSLAEHLASEKISSAGKFRIAAAILRAGSPELSSAFVEALMTSGSYPTTGQDTIRWKSEQIALALIAFRQCPAPMRLSLPRSLVLDSISCGTWIAALESGSREIPALSALLEYIRREALRSSKTIGSLRMARSLHLLRLCIERRPEEIFHSGLDLTKIIPKAPTTVAYECPMTGNELVGVLLTARRNNRAFKLATRLQDLLQLRELPRAPLYAFLLEYLNEYGLLRDPRSGETLSVEASLWFDLLRFAASPTLVQFEQIVTEATSKPYSILDDAIRVNAQIAKNYRPSPLYIAVERRLRTSPNAYLSYCLETIQEAMETFHASLERADGSKTANDVQHAAAEKPSCNSENPRNCEPAPDECRLERLHATSIADVRDFVQNGSLRFVLLFCSAAEEEQRRKAYDIVATVYELLPGAVEFRERQLVRTVLDLLRCSITNPYASIPRIQCVLFGSLAEIVANAAHELYPLARRVILQRPMWTLTEELPGVHQMLSSTERRVQEFLLYLLLEGNDGSRAFYAILRRHRLYSYLVGRKMFALRLPDRLQLQVDRVLTRLQASATARKSLERTWSLDTWQRILSI
jgi:hypothetical protein